MSERSIKCDVLAYWGQATHRAFANGYSVSIKLAPQGFEVWMVGPAGDQAALPVPYDELAQATTPKGAIDEIIAVLRKQLKVPSKIITTLQ